MVIGPLQAAAWRVFYTMPNRVSYIIDGFNLYHSVKDASRHLHLNGAGTKWLNIRAVCESYLPRIGNNATLQEIHYFSALATHLDTRNPVVTNRHRLFIKCIREGGIKIHLSKFKAKQVYCPNCNQHHRRFEEKETDVALSAMLFELLASEDCDTVMVMTGDTDITPAIQTAKRLYANQKQVGIIFPYLRKSNELARLADFSFNLRPTDYRRHQFPNQITLSDGTIITKPPRW